MCFSRDNHHSTNQLTTMNKFILLVSIATALALPQGKKQIQHLDRPLLQHTFYYF